MRILIKNMAEYIEREKIQKRLNRIVEVNNLRTDRAWFTPYGVNALIEEIPAADVRPVVLCRDCKYAPIGDKDGSDLEWPFNEFDENPCPYKCLDNWYSHKPAPGFFCAAGEKREES